MKLRVLFFGAALALAGSAFAANPPPPAASGANPQGSHMGPCEKDPSKCQAEAAKFDQWCSANAEKCMNLKAWAEKRREACEKNKQKCEERREKMRQWHEEHRAMKQDQKQSGQPENPGQPDEPGDDQMPPPPPVF